MLAWLGRLLALGVGAYVFLLLLVPLGLLLAVGESPAGAVGEVLSGRALWQKEGAISFYDVAFWGALFVVVLQGASTFGNLRGGAK